MIDRSIGTGILTDLLTSSTILVGHIWEYAMLVPKIVKWLFLGSIAHKTQCSQATKQVDLNWYAPNATQINNLTSVINGTDVYGFIFNSSLTPAGSPYGTYNWCNMPHVRPQEYVTPPDNYKLEYVEVVCFLTLSRRPDSIDYSRSTAITRERRTPPTSSPTKHIHGLVTTRLSSSTESVTQTTRLPKSTGKSTLQRPTL
jgi:hypothetical protein